MARRRKGANAVQMAAPEGEHSNTSIDSAENGYIVHVSGSKGGKHPSYFSKRYIAHSHPHALRLAASHHAGTMKGGSKRGGRKKASAKG